MIQIPNFNKLRDQLLSDPVFLREMCLKLGIIQEKQEKATSRVLGKWESNGFSVTSWVDDDELSEEEKNVRYADLADKCIKSLKQNLMKGDLKR